MFFKADLFHPGIFILYNKWISNFRDKLHLQIAKQGTKKASQNPQYWKTSKQPIPHFKT